LKTLNKKLVKGFLSVVLFFSFHSSINAQGQTLNFNGTSDRVNVPSLSFGTTWTAEAWFRPTFAGDGNWNVIMGQSNYLTPSAGGFVVAVSSNSLFMETPGGTNIITSVTNNAWTHVAVTFNNGIYALYKNGLLIGVKTGTFGNASSTFYLGTRNNNTNSGLTDYYEGDIDEVRIWNTTRSQCAIQQFMNCEISTSFTGLVANYHFNEGISSSLSNFILGNTFLPDATGNANTGTLNFPLIATATSNWISPGSPAQGLTTPASASTATINITGNGNNITDGSVSTSTLNNTNFGSAITRTFVIQNTGSQTLNVGTPVFTGLNASEFTVAVIPSPILAATTGTTSFVVALTPTSVGTKSAVLNIYNSECTKTIYDFVITATAVAGAALNFDGVDDYVELSANIAELGKADFTIESWIKTTSVSQGIVVFSDVDAVWEIGEKAFYLNNLGQLTFVGFGNNYMNSTLAVNDGNWHHVAVTWDYSGTGTSGVGKIYVDGVDKTGAVNYAATNNNMTGGFKIGRPNFQPGEAPNYFAGTIDEVRIYDRALCLDELLNNMNCEIPSPTGYPNLNGYYKLNGGIAFGVNPTANIAADAATFGNNGTLTNFSLTSSGSNWTSPGAVTTGANCAIYLFPEINLRGNGTNISNNDATPSLTDFTDFGAVALASQLSRTFVIQSTGTGSIAISGFSLSGINASSFTITTSPSASVLSGASTTIVVTFSSAVLGVKNASLVILSDDCDEPVTAFAITATAAAAAAALNFDGTGDAINTTDPVIGLGNFTIEGWIKPNALTGGFLLSTRFNEGFQTGFWYSIGYGSGFVGMEMAECGNGAGNYVGSFSSTQSITPGTWGHFAIVRSGSIYSMYINGNISATFTEVASHNFDNVGVNPSHILNIGGWIQNSCCWFGGSMDELRIWKVARTQCEIQSFMNCEIPTTATNLASNYHFNHGADGLANPTITRLTDASASAYTGTLNASFALTGSTSNWVAPGGVANGFTTSSASQATLLITGNSNTIIAGSTSPLLSNFTDFGTNLTRTFVITNPGAGPLYLTTGYFTGTNASNFVVSTTPSSLIAGSGGTSSFVITFTPTALGTASAILNIVSSDCTSPTYSFVVTASTTPASALSFDGVNDVVTTPPVNLNNQSFTVEFWAKKNTLFGAGYVFGQNNNNTLNQSLHIGFSSNSVFKFAFWGNDLIYSPGSLDNNWHHWACSYNASSAGIDRFIYMDGVLVASDNSPSNYIGSATGLLIGVGNGFYYTGNADEVRVWNTVRTQCQIQTFMNCEIPTTATGLVANYHFNQGIPSGANPTTTLLTNAAVANTGTLTSFVLTGAVSNWISPGGVISGSILPAPPTASILVTGNSNSITPGSITTSTLDFTNFGNVTTRNYVIQNSSVTGTLYINTVSFSGANAGDFIISTLPASSITTGSTNFVITFTPTALGTRSAIVTVNSSDCTSPNYSFVITASTSPASALAFDGVDDFVDCGTDPSLDITLGTWEAWVNLSTLASNSRIFFKENFNGGGLGMFESYYLASSGKFKGDLKIGVTNYFVEGSSNPTTNVWYHVALTYDGTYFKLYLNGVLDGVSAISGGTMNSGTGNLSLGASITNPNSSGLTGKMDEARLWNVVRTQCEIQTFMNCEIPTTATGLVANYHFNQGIPSGSNTAVTTLTDAAGSNTGTLSNMALTGTISNWVSPSIIANDYTTSVAPTGALTLYGNANSIPMGAATTTLNNTDFGTLNSRVFLIQNPGAGPLYVNSVSFSGANASSFSLITVPSNSIASVGNSIFTLSFTPTALGSQSAIVTINSSDCANPNYTFVITASTSPASALNFDGSDDYINCGNILNSSYTKEAWIKLNIPVTVANNIISGGISGPHAFWLPGGVLSAGHNPGIPEVTDSGTLSAGVWHHVAVTYDAPSTSMRLYKNGVLISQNNNVAALGSGLMTLLGSFEFSNLFYGTLDEVRIWNVVRSQCDIQSYMNCEIPTSATGLVANYHFNQGIPSGSNTAVTTLTDAAGSNNGTLTNFALTSAASNWINPGGVISGSILPAPPTASILVSGNSNSITPGSITTSTLNFTNFGNVTTRTFVIQNSNTGTLNIAVPYFTGLNTSEFSVTVLPTLSLSASATTSFVVVFTPTVLGFRTATLNINTNDCGIPIFNCAIGGTPVPASALRFDGVDDFINIPSSSLPSGNADFTEEFWVKVNSSQISHRWISFWGVPGTSGEMVTIGYDGSAGNKIRIHHVGPDLIANTAALPIGVWTHVAVNYHGSSNSHGIFINGNYIETLSFGTNSLNIPASPNLQLGTFNSLPQYAADMDLDEVRFWNVARTQCEIQDNMNCEIATTATGLLANYHFNQGVPFGPNSTFTLATDATGANTGTLTSFSLSGSSSNWVNTGAVISNSTCPIVTYPEIDVQGNSVSIVNNSTLITSSNFTDFNNSFVGTSATRTFVILNTGSASLSISNYSLSGVNASAFSITSVPAIVVAPSGSTSIVVTFSPATIGIKDATLNIINADCNEAVYSFAIQGKGIQQAEALDFDGVNDYVDLGSTANLKPTAALTAEAWVNSNWPSTDQTIFGNTENAGYGLFTRTTGVLEGLVRRNSTWASVTVSLSTLTSGWHHTAMTYDGRYTKLYVDGVLKSTNDALATYTIDYIGNNTLIGGEASAGSSPISGWYFAGKVDELRIWNLARSQCQIQTYMATELPGGATGLLANYHFNEGLVAQNNAGYPTVPDFAGSSNTGTLTGFALTSTVSNWVIGGAVPSGVNAMIALTPTLATTGNGNTISPGSSSTSTNNFTDFGTSTSRTFVLQNSGTGTLYINSPVTLSGANASDFSITAQPSASITNGTTNFVVSFIPAAIGTRTAIVTVNSADCSFPDYSFVISGTAIVGAALNFDGVDDGASRPLLTSANNSITLQTKVFINANPTTNKIIAYNGSSGANGYGLYMFANNPEVNIIYGGVAYLPTSYSLTLNQWNSLTMVIENTTVKLYANGILAYSNVTITPAVPTGSFLVGVNNIGTENFNGSIDEVLLWSRPLSQCEIQANLNCEIATTGNSLVANYHFNQGIAGGTNTLITLTDASGNNNNLTLSNFALSGLISNWVSPGAVVSGSSCPAFIAPEINLLGSALTILDGDITPSLSDDTDFGNISTNSLVTRSYTIQNTGGSALAISSITLGGTGASQFSVGALSPASPVAIGGSAVFTVTFAPTSSGVTTASLVITNNDCDESPYDFVITGTANVGAALTLDGTNDYVNCGNILPASYTKEGWIRLSASLTNGNNVISGGSGSNGHALWAPGSFGNKLSAGHNLGWAQVQDPTGLNLNQWYHVAVSYDAPTQTMILYKNGLVVATNSTVPAVVGSDPVSIGAFSGNFSMSGAVDEVRIWNRALCQTEIQNNMNCEIATTATGLIANYHFNQGVGYGSNLTTTLVTDVSGSANTGTLVNFAFTGTLSNWIATSTVTTGSSCAPISVPEINVLGNAVTIVDGDIIPSLTDHTSFGAICIGTTVTRSYTVQNAGFANLTVASITMSGTDATLFTVGALTPASPILPGSQAIFTVNFNPTTSGVKNATINIINNDCNESPYDYAVTGTCNALPVVTANTASAVICSGITTTLTGGGASTYTWTGGTPTVTNGVAFSPTTSLTYTVNGTDALTGCTSTNLATQLITVNANPTITASTNNTVICNGAALAITPGGAATYSVNPGILSGTGFTLSPSANVVYSVTGTSANGCAGVNTVAISVAVNALPTVTANATQTAICNGFSTSVFGSGASTYTWSGAISATNTVAFSPTVTSSYTVNGTNALTGCTSTNLAVVSITVDNTPIVTIASSGSVICNGGSATLTAVGAASYTWNAGVSNATIFAVSPSTLTTYTLTGSSLAGCTSMNTAIETVSVNALPIVTASISNTMICAGQSITVNGSGASTYSWTNGALDGVSFAPAISTTFALTGTNTAGCTSTNVTVVSVTVNALPSLTINATNSAICLGGSTKLSGSGAATYTWNTGISDNVVFSPTSTASYTLSATDANNCENTAVATITVNNLPLLSVSGSPSISCEAESSTLTVSGAATYSWSSGENTASIVITPTATSIFTISATDVNSCTNTVVYTQSVMICPASFTAFATKKDISCIGKDDGYIAIHTVSSYSRSSITYVWGSPTLCPASTCDSIFNQKSGSYKVTVKITYTVNGSLVKTDSVVIDPIVLTDLGGTCEVKVFTGVTPNGDGINDVLLIDNIEEFPNNKVTVYNRWGTQVFEMKGYNNLDKAWPMKDDTSKLSSNTYFYLIDLGNGSKVIKGWIELIK